MSGKRFFVGINAEPVDPAVAIVSDGRLLAFAEEERFLRYKHAPQTYPARALRFCLEHAGIGLAEVAAVAVAWDTEAYADGRMSSFFDRLAQDWPVDAATRGWQAKMIETHRADKIAGVHVPQWTRVYGRGAFPPIVGVAHHFTHAFHAFMQSPFDAAICLTMDGSGDEYCTVVWRCEGNQVTPIRALRMPHSLGWFYAAITEYLGFTAYDGEYKVMGLAAYGRAESTMLARLRQIVRADDDGIEYRLDPSFIHFGAHSFSGRYTDKLVDLFGRPPRLAHEPIEAWHENLAYAAQQTLEDCATRLVRWAVDETGLHNVCVSGGVALNVKMNSALLQLPAVADVFALPLCGDSGSAAGAALAVCFAQTGTCPEKLRTLAVGPEFTNDEIETALQRAHIAYQKPNDICEAVAEALAQGKIVGWFQGRMEAGARALGQRSILADPRQAQNRDKVNSIVKFREYWRPFCPSINEEAMAAYFDRLSDNTAFMTIALHANARLKCEAPAIVHIDGTARVQVVRKADAPLYHRLIEAFARRTGVPVLLNTSFNVKGEPIVCTPQDALRTFWSTGLDVLAIGDYLVEKTIS